MAAGKVTAVVVADVRMAAAAVVTVTAIADDGQDLSQQPLFEIARHARPA
jgi:hypothetical protein